MSKRSNHFPRSAGILLPLFSVPEEQGPGTLHGATEVVRWLASAGIRWWQMLPLTLPDSTGSPYASPSTMGFGWHIISRQALQERGWLQELPTPYPRRHDRRGWDRYQRRTLWQAWQGFQRLASVSERKRFESFCVREQSWLDRHTLFFSLRDRFGDQPWWTWPVEFREYRQACQADDLRLKNRIVFHSWVQWVADEQWKEFRAFAHRHKVSIIGDVPFFIRADSVAVWSQPELFAIEAHGRVARGVGAPPDAFAPDGQWWGNPAYAWEAHRRTKFTWWRRRLSWAESQYDALRLDHFHGYLRTWTISARTHDAKKGEWLPTPPTMCSMIRSFTKPILVEDLGEYFPEAEVARKKLGVYGTRVWEFGWNGYPDNPHAVADVVSDAAFYSSTHDLPPIRTWLRQRRHRAEVQRIQKATGHRVTAELAIDSVVRSRAAVAIIAMGDILPRKVQPINSPGTSRGNWRWQLRADDLSGNHARHLRSVLRASGRFLV